MNGGLQIQLLAKIKDYRVNCNSLVSSIMKKVLLSNKMFIGKASVNDNGMVRLKAKLSVCLIKYHTMKTYWEVEV
jgi:hypothetical protein